MPAPSGPINPKISPGWTSRQTPRTASVSPYGLFLAGQAAGAGGDSSTAADYYAAAARDLPDQGFLQDHAFTAALLSGDVSKAAALAPAKGQGDVSIGQLGLLTVAINDMAEDHPRDAEGVLASADFVPPNRVAQLLLAPWAAAAAGDWKTALALPDAKGDRLVAALTQLNQALLLERGKRYALADAAFRRLLAEGDGEGLITADYVAFLERRGRRTDAVALCDASLKGDPTARYVRQLRDRAASGAPAPALLSWNDAAAEAIITPAAIFLAEKQPELGLDYLSLALRLNPHEDEAWMLVGDTKNAVDDSLGARAAYLNVTPTSPDYIDARGRLIATYDQTADAAKIVDLAQETVKNAPNDDGALVLLADALNGAERYDEASKVMDTLMQHLGANAGWDAYFTRGIALDRSGRWPEAEADFRKALALKPDESDVLNYLGYSWIDRGEKLQEAKAMVEKAVAAKPDSGAMVDSLGWAYYRLGDFKRAVEQLERACELEPADPDINNHLGDAYWQAGRRNEAHFQWARVLTLSPSAKLRAEVQLKLQNGLAADGAPAAPPAAIAAR